MLVVNNFVSLCMFSIPSHVCMQNDCAKLNTSRFKQQYDLSYITNGYILGVCQQ